jgi:FdhD protein
MEEFVVEMVDGESRLPRTVKITSEVPLTIEANGRELATLLSSPSDLEDLVRGFLYTAGLINEAQGIKRMIIDEERWQAVAEITEEGLPEELVFKRIYTSGCGRGIVFHNPFDLLARIRLAPGPSCPAAFINETMREFLHYSNEYRQTRGVHSAALVDFSGIKVFRDDVGRHNAIDKVIGWSLAAGLRREGLMLFTSGRISSEIISKLLRARIPLVASSGAPTNQAVKMAREVDLTLLGLVRGKQMAVFSGGERIVL